MRTVTQKWCCTAFCHNTTSEISVETKKNEQRVQRKQQHACKCQQQPQTSSQSSTIILTADQPDVAPEWSLQYHALKIGCKRKAPLGECYSSCVQCIEQGKPLRNLGFLPDYPCQGQCRWTWPWSAMVCSTKTIAVSANQHIHPPSAQKTTQWACPWLQQAPQDCAKCKFARALSQHVFKAHRMTPPRIICQMLIYIVYLLNSIKNKRAPTSGGQFH